MPKRKEIRNSTAEFLIFQVEGKEQGVRQADKGNKYITASMSVKNSEKDPKLPQLAVYKIEGKI